MKEKERLKNNWSGARNWLRRRLQSVYMRVRVPPRPPEDFRMKYYAGIGARSTPSNVLQHMTNMAKVFKNRGFILRSGGAVGADQAFHRGAGYSSEIFEASSVHSYSTRFSLCYEIASRYHPRWSRCSKYAKKLHMRNVMILLGEDLDKPVDFVVCWTKDGDAIGGTGQSIRMARSPEYNIPVYNLAIPEDIEKFMKFTISMGD